MSDDFEILWTPPDGVREATRMGRFLDYIEGKHGVQLPGYEDAWRWSVDNLDDFWMSLVQFMGVDFTSPPTEVLADDQMPGARWFPDATLNYAQHLLHGDLDRVLLEAHSEAREPVTLTRRQLRDQVAAMRQSLADLGVEKGDRVAAYLPNCPEAVIGLLASASLGAIWSICSPEFGARGAKDRLEQIEPKVLLVADGYRYGGEDFVRTTEIEELRGALTDLVATVWIPYLGSVEQPEDTTSWASFVGDPTAPLALTPVEFDHPLYILYSSGTTGRPKPIVLSHGGMLLEHLKWLGIHDDLGDSDRYFWYSSTAWMAWNLGVSAMLLDATLVTWDGAPAHPSLEFYWKFIGDQSITYLGTSPGILEKSRSQGIVPSEIADLSNLRMVVSGGAPLPAELFRWVYDSIHEDLYLASGSGGTDIGSSFVGGCPLLPVRAGEIACRLLGVDVAAYDEHGEEVVGRRGELVVRKPMPSMLVGFWGDDGSRLRETYFSHYPGVWRHGDWVRFTDAGTALITGRSDATLNRGGVRLGTSEFYSVISEFHEIEDSLIIHLEDPHGGLGDLRLFVSLEAGHELDESLRQRLRDGLRDELSPRHVPDHIEEVPTIPRTVTGKKMEVPVKNILAGEDIEEAASMSSLAVPGSLDPFVEMAQDSHR